MQEVILLLVFFFMIGYYLAFMHNASNPNHPDDMDFRKKYRFDIRPNQEKPVQVQKLVIYPCRGLQPIEVDHIKVSKVGIKYDREWCVYYRNEKMSAITLGPEIKFSLLKQSIEKDQKTKQKYLVITCVDPKEAAKLPSKELRIPIRKILEGEVIVTSKGQGISEGSEADAWFTKFLEKEVFLLRSAPNYTKAVPKKALPQTMEGDITHGFVSKASIHIVNEASVRDLRERVLSKMNEEDKAKTRIEAIPFRPNIIIDSGIPYSEDTMQEARIGNVLMRLVGYCSRCKVVTCNYDTFDRNPNLEPTETLAQFRKNEWGTLFGTYHQVEVIGSHQQFRRLLPEFAVPKNRKLGSDYGVICVGDEIRVRVAEQRINFEQK